MKSNVPSEDAVVDQITKWLDTLERCYYEKTHGGIYGARGKPDLTGCLYGHRFEIECKKKKGGATTSSQMLKLRKWEQAGAIALYAKSVEDVKQAFANAGLMLITKPKRAKGRVIKQEDENDESDD